MATHQARKRFGQNFLQDDNIIQSIIQAIRPEKQDIIIEIGPGMGAITRPLIKEVEHLHVVEIDRDIVAYLKKQDFANQLIIHECDVLQFDFASISGQKKIVGNLPYNISTPLLFHLCTYHQDISEMHFMLQKEVVDRMCAIPNSADYGRLSVMLQYFFDMESILDVPPQAFDPAPKVNSSVIRMIPQLGRIGIAQDFVLFEKVVRSAFAMRRKTLHNTLKELMSDNDFTALNISSQKRAQELSADQFVLIANYLANR